MELLTFLKPEVKAGCPMLLSGAGNETTDQRFRQVTLSRGSF